MVDSSTTMASQFGVTVKQLRELMELRGAEGVEKIREYGGIHELCKKLKTTEQQGEYGKSILDLNFL